MMLGGLLLIFVIIVTYQLGTFEPPATAPRTPSNLKRSVPPQQQRVVRCR
jgi:hypothetical protein